MRLASSRSRHLLAVSNLAALAVAFGLCTNASAQTSTYQEHGKLVRAPRDIARLGADLFGDKVNLYTGALEFVQTDVSLPGNSALPVSVGRRLVVGQEGISAALFGKWDLEIPHLHGVFAAAAGWQAGNGSDRNARCSAFGPPPNATGSFGSNSSWSATEFWHGSFLYVPGAGDQEMLRRSVTHTKAPGDNVGAYPVVTRNNWAIRCLPSMAPGNGALGEGFVAVSPDGTEYKFDWLIQRSLPILRKSNSGPELGLKSSPSVTAEPVRNSSDAALPGASSVVQIIVPPGDETPNAIDGNALSRVEVWILPTTVTDRFGNTVIYTYNPTNKRQLTSIVANDAAGSPRSITLAYGAAGTGLENMVTTVFDGTRTWTYGYDSANITASLSTVTLPDGSSWRELNSLAGLLNNVEYAGEGGCDFPGYAIPTVLTGHLIHPSGARGDFALTPISHGRSGVEYRCDLDVSFQTYTPYYPKVFDTNALTSKTISGPTIPTMTWSTTYSPEASSWGPCNGCNATTKVEVRDPAGNKIRYTFGTLFRQTEGQLQQTEVLDDPGNVLSSTTQQYTDPIPPLGVSDQRRGDGEMSARVSEVNLRQTAQQGISFAWHATVFDEYAKPTQVARSSALGSRTENMTYENNTTKWALGQVKTVTEALAGKVMLDNRYNVNSAQLESVRKFNHLEHSMTYNADGTLLTKSDGLGHATSFANYKRGLPTNVTYPDSSTESAEVNNDGTIASVTDALGLRTQYFYDPAGRLNRIVHPRQPGDPAWNDTTLTFAQINTEEFGLASGHWRQDVVTGNGWTRIYLDQMWRPAYTWTYDANGGSTPSLVKTEVDHAGRSTFSSYPRPANDQYIGEGVRTFYDALGRTIEVRSDTELGPSSTLSYYDSGFAKRVIDPLGHVTVTSYQALDTPSEDAITSISAPEGLLVTINRDTFGKPVAITRSGNGASATRSYVYDSTERLCKTIEPETGATLQQLDDANNVAWRAPGTSLTSASCDWASVPLSARIAFGYDSLNRLLSTTYGDGSATITRDYWADGQPKTVASSGAVWTMNYNGRRLPTTQSLAFEGQTYTLENQYNANGHPIQLSYPAATNPIANRSVLYEPDGLGRATRIGSYASGIQYHPNGAVAGFAYGNGKVRNMTQYRRGLPELAQDGGVLQDLYVYDKKSNVTSITDQMGNGTSRTMGYDGLDRLTSANAPGLWGNAVYGYDTLDNLRSSTVGARVSTYIYNTRNLLESLQSTAAGFSFNFGYDSRGNVTQRGTQAFGFDLGNRLATATNLDSYVYDGFGRRVKTTALDGTVTITVYGPGGQLLYSRRTGGPNPAKSTQYIYLHQHQIAEVTR